MNFTQLHFHTDYSIRDGFIKINDLIDYCKANGYPAVSITDHGNMCGSLILYQGCKKQGLKPIIGCELYVVDDLSNTRKRDHIVLISKNLKGFGNLIRIHNYGWEIGYYRGFPVVDYDFIYNNSEGLICFTACAAGKMSKLIMDNKTTEAATFAKKLKKIFKKDLYIELLSIDYDKQPFLNKHLAKIAKHLNIKTIWTNDSHYLSREDKKVHDFVLLLANKNKLSDIGKKGVWTFGTTDLFFKTPRQFERDYLKRFSDIPRQVFNESMENIGHVINSVQNFDIDASIKTPKWDVDKTNSDNYETVLGMCLDALNTMGLKNDEYLKRLNYELSILTDREYLDYYLIIKDLIDYSKKLDPYSLGAGRGSAAGSLVSYLLGITQIDPIKWGLLFERFLNVGRSDPPDIDVDFSPVIRDKIKDYIKEKYGSSSCSIGAFGELKFRACLLDVGRTLDIPIQEVLRITKRITSDADMMTLDEAKKTFDFLDEFLNKRTDV
jgi:DNA polymerase-3 subunit alpha